MHNNLDVHPKIKILTKKSDTPILETPSQGPLFPMIKTEEQFNTELVNLTGVSIPKTPCKFITWNANGIKHRLAETNNKKKLKAFIEAEKPDIFAVQEVHIAAHPERGRSFPMPGDNATCYEEYKALFVNYDFYASFATTRAAGQIVAVSKSCEKPHVTYTFDTEKTKQLRYITVKAEQLYWISLV